MWPSTILTDSETPGDLLGLEAAGEHAEDLGFALGQPGSALQSRHPLPCRLHHGGDRVGVEAAGARLASQVLGRPFGATGSRCGRGSHIAWKASAAASRRAGSASSTADEPRW